MSRTEHNLLLRGYIHHRKFCRPGLPLYWPEPPEMVMTWPLTQPPSSDARKPTTRATSSGTAQRPRGQWSAIIFSTVAAGMSGVPPGM